MNDLTEAVLHAIVDDEEAHAKFLALCRKVYDAGIEMDALKRWFMGACVPANSEPLLRETMEGVIEYGINWRELSAAIIERARAEVDIYLTRVDRALYYSAVGHLPYVMSIQEDHMTDGTVHTRRQTTGSITWRNAVFDTAEALSMETWCDLTPSQLQNFYYLGKTSEEIIAHLPDLAAEYIAEQDEGDALKEIILLERPNMTEHLVAVLDRTWSVTRTWAKQLQQTVNETRLS